MVRPSGCVDGTTHIACEVFLFCQDFVINVQLLGQVCDRLIIDSFIGLKALESAEKSVFDVTRYDEEISMCSRLIHALDYCGDSRTVKMKRFN